MSQTMNEDLNVIANSDLEITYLDGDLAIIQQLDDEPNDVGGLTSAQLKAKFDQAGLAIQSYLNNTLIPELLAADATEAAREAAEAGRQAAEQARVTAEAARAAAEQDRVNTTSGIVAQATQKANEAAASAVRAEQVALGNIPDGSLAKAKLVQEVQSTLDRAAQGGAIDITLANNDPKNWGLGVAAAYWPPDNNADNISVTGWNYSMGATTNGLTAGFLFTQVLNEDHAVQFWEALESGNTGRAMRKKVLGGWQPWEWINPPMESGIEYRTTERYLGKPVYYKLVDFGSLPNATQKSVYYGSTDVIGISVESILDPTNKIDFLGSVGNGYIDNWFLSTVYAGARVTITTSVDRSGYSVQVKVKYYKTTD